MNFLASRKEVYYISFSGLSQYAAMFLTIIIRTTYKTPALPPLLNATVYLSVCG